MTPWYFNVCAVTLMLMLLPQNRTTENQQRDLFAARWDAEAEVRLWDNSRVDLMMGEYAIEIDWAKKWAEAVGQSLYYAELTHKRPGILLLLRSDDEMRYALRCQVVCARAGITLWVERPITDGPHN